MRRMGEVEAHIPALRYLLSVDPGDPAFAAMEAVARRRRSSLPCAPSPCAGHACAPWCWWWRICTGSTPAAKSF